MKPKRKRPRTVRRSAATLKRIARNVGKSAELSAGANHVIAKRTALIAAAVAIPLTGNYAEFSRMIPEKGLAFTDAAARFAFASMRSGFRMQSALFQEWLRLGNVWRATLSAPGPTAAVAVQSKYALGVWERTVAEAEATTTDLSRAFAEVIAPLHKSVLGNLRRLT